MSTKTSEKGIALATAIIILFLAAALVAGFSWLVMTDQKLGGVNGNEQYAFYGAEAGMEKLTANLGTLFSANPAPSGAAVDGLATAANVPTIAGIQYQNPDGTLGYEIDFPTDANGNPLSQNHTILSGPYQGLTGLLTPFTLKVTARTVTGGSEVRLQRETQTVSIPVFQFGIFSQTDLSFFAGPNFNFGGRVQTNGDLFLASGADLYFFDKVTAAGQVVRQTLSNNWPTSSGYTGNVFIPTTSGGCNSVPGSSTASCRILASTEGSVTGPIGAWVANNPPWNNLSLGTYNGYVRSQATGAKPLNLSIALNAGANPIDLIRRPAPGEDVSAASVLAQRYYSEASVRILLSDNPADIANLPCESVTPPTALTGSFGGIPIATSGATSGSYSPSNGYWSPNGTQVLSGGAAGYIKIEIQTTYAVPPAACGTWKDVTAEVLGFGIAGRNLNPYNSASANWTWVNSPNLPNSSAQTAQVPPSGCSDPSPNAIIRLERVRDNPSTGQSGGITLASAACGFNAGAPSNNAYDYWPNALFDTREGSPRDTCPDGTNPISTTCTWGPSLGGVMDYTELDVANLAKFLTGVIGTDGTQAKDPNDSSYDFVVYFSDRRGNYTPAPVAGWPPASPSGNETGEYGFEDSINPPSQYGCPNGTLDTGETLDEVENPVNQQVGGAPEDYGVFPAPLLQAAFSGFTGGAPLSANPKCPGPAGASLTNPWPMMLVQNPYEARENTPLFFRRALKIVDGSSISLSACPDGQPCGLTVASENPVYVQDDFNANAGEGNFNGAHVATAVVADAVTMLSNNWNDANSFIVNTGQGASPYSTNWRAASTTTYRFGVAAGKGISFSYPGYGSYQDFGTDGGVHNFLRFLENWGGQTLWYRGSIVSFYYNRQATGVYKCCNTVYSPPSRGYNFDSDFLTPSLLPPRTPMFRDVNTVGFSQLILPNQ